MAKKKKKKVVKREKVMYFGEEKYLDELTDSQINKMKQAELTKEWEHDQWGW